MPSAEAEAPVCTRCKANASAYNLRNEDVCSQCFRSFISVKAVKRLELLQRETRSSGSGSTARGQPPKSQRYLLALSPGGVSSTALLSALWENLRQQRERKQKVRFELLVAIVDTDLNSSISNEDRPASSLLMSDPAGLDAVIEQYKARFEETEFKKIRLEDVLDLDTIDWTTLFPPPNKQENDDVAAVTDPELVSSRSGRRQQLADLFARLPSTTSRADILRLFTRHLLVHTAVREGCDVLLMGYNTTSLAELTLSETAKGRGFAVPWGVNDGIASLPRVVPRDQPQQSTTSVSEDQQQQQNGSTDEGAADAEVKIPIYHPMREIFRKELVIYSSLTTPPLTPLLAGSASGKTRGAAVVSHKDLSIDDVMARYFAEVEENYPSVVANVVRTTGKLNRSGNSENGSCGLCGLGLDEVGDERWRGELGEQKSESGDRGTLCYGCERSVYG